MVQEPLLSAARLRFIFLPSLLLLPCRELEAQREQLMRIQRKVDEVEAHAERGNFIVKGMKGLFGGIKNHFRKQPELPKELVMKRDAERQAKLEAIDAEIERRNASRDAKTAAKYNAGVTASTPAGAGAGAGPNKTPTDAALLKGKDPALDARIAEEDAMLDLISKGLTNIKAIGVAMGDELTRQDVLIDDLSKSLDRAGNKIDHVRNEADKLAK